MTCVVKLDLYVYASFRVSFFVFIRNRAVALAIEIEKCVLMNYVYREQ